jgi:hypothetical protein
MRESLKKESKRWLKALRANDGRARARFVRLHPTPPASPTLRDVQLALARERGFAGWAELKAKVAAQPPRDAAHAKRVQWFLENACPDHHVIAHDSFCTEVVCGNQGEVERLLTGRPLAASALCETPDSKREDAASDDWLKDLGPKAGSRCCICARRGCRSRVWQRIRSRLAACCLIAAPIRTSSSWRLQQIRAARRGDRRRRRTPQSASTARRAGASAAGSRCRAVRHSGHLQHSFRRRRVVVLAIDL